MEYHDKVLKCSECGAEFVFTAGEQMFFADKGFKNEPKRCKGCKAKRAEGDGEAEVPVTDSIGNEDHLLAVREGNDRSFPPDARTPGLLPGMFPAAQSDGCGIVRFFLSNSGLKQAPVPYW